MARGKGRYKPCAYCGVAFWCIPFLDVGGAGTERKHCSERCMRVNRTPTLDNADRWFWPKVERGEGCWLWNGRKDASGYGRYDRKGPFVYAHRIAWLCSHGEIPADKDVCHTCDVRNCCNPAHLFLGTHQENIADQVAKGRTTRGERNHWANFTNAQAEEVRSQIKRWGPRKTNCQEIADKYGVRVGVIHALMRGETYRQNGNLGDLCRD